MKNTNNRSGSVSAVTTKETNLKVFGNKDVAEMSIEVIEDLLDKEKGPVRPYTDGDIIQRFKYFLSEEYDPNSFVLQIDRKKGIVYAAPIDVSLSKKERLESDFVSGKEVDSKEYCSLCKKYMNPDNSVAVPGGVTCNGIFASCGAIPCKYFEKKSEMVAPIEPVLGHAIYNCSWYSALSEEQNGTYNVIAKDEYPHKDIVVATNSEQHLATHICKTHNDWLKFKQKNGEKKVAKNNLRRAERLSWRMKTFKNAFKLIQKNNYLGFDSIKVWAEQNEDDVNQWIFTKWLKNSFNYEDWTWFYNNRGTSLQTIPSNEYFEICDSCEFIDYFQFGNHKTMNGVPEEEWDSYTLHDEYESKLFADGKAYTAALILEKMFDFAEDYVKNTGWITAEMADKYHIDLKLVSSDSLKGIQKALVTASVVAGEELSKETREEVLKKIINPARHACMDALKDESHDKPAEENSELKDSNVNPKLCEVDPLYRNASKRFKSMFAEEKKKEEKVADIEKRIDGLEKMVRDIWENVCADKQPTPYTEAPSHGSSSSADEWNKADGVETWNDEDYTLPTEIINKKPVLKRQTCPRCKKSKEGCEFYDKGTCRGIVYPTYPPQYDPCVFEK